MSHWIHTHDARHDKLSLPDNQLLTQLFTALEEESVNVDMISQIVNLEGLQLSFQLKIVMHIKFLQFLENLSTHFSALDYKINEAYVKISLIDQV